MNEHYYIRWQDWDDAGEARRWYYLEGFEYGREGLIAHAGANPAQAISYPEAIAEWLCELLDEQNNLNPEMVRI